MRTIYWDKTTNQVKTIDQRELPGNLVWVTLNNGDEVTEAIQNMTIRGAPVIGAAGAYGIALTAFRSQAKTPAEIVGEVKAAGFTLQAARPTAVNLRWAISRMDAVLSQEFKTTELVQNTLLKEAEKIAEEDVLANCRMASFGKDMIQDGDVIIHHCNTGSLATVEGGTALGVIMEAWKIGKRFRVLVDETRPLFQGSRLTAWELQQSEIPFEIITDSAAGYFLEKQIATKVMFGADRVAVNGDVVNKVGSYLLSLAAHANNIPVYSVFPESSLDRTCKSGLDINIEFRDEAEVLDTEVRGKKVSPEDAHAKNPAFDITPNHLITAWITDLGIIHPPFNINTLARTVKK
jgi:methylthioribose-1-phosphate isomerase